MKDEDKIPCPNCQHLLKVFAPDPEILTTPKLSMMTFVHEVGINCRSCGKYYVPTFSVKTVCAFQLVEMPRPGEDQEDLIKKPSESEIRLVRPN